VDVEEQAAVVGGRDARVGAPVGQHAARIRPIGSARADDVPHEVLYFGFRRRRRPAIGRVAGIAAGAAGDRAEAPGEVAIEVDAVGIGAAAAIGGVDVLAPGQPGLGFLPAVGIACRMKWKRKLSTIQVACGSTP
jgi:hypothetical protein